MSIGTVVFFSFVVGLLMTVAIDLIGEGIINVCI